MKGVEPFGALAMKRLLDAARNSARAWTVLIRNEAAFRLEVILLSAALPAAWMVSASSLGFLLLVGVILLLLIVEVLNTAIEAACNALSREYNADIRLAKDCGSLAVAMTALVAIGTWLHALWNWAAGTPV